MTTAGAAAARPRGRYSHPRSAVPSASNSMSVTSCAASVLKISRVLVRLEYIADFIVNANHEVSTEPAEAREPLQPATAGQRTNLRCRHVGPERVSHTGQSIDDDRLSNQQTDCRLKDDEVRGSADQPKGHNQRRRPRRRMR